MFGREPNVPVDLVFGVRREDNKEPVIVYADNIRQRIQLMRLLAIMLQKRRVTRKRTMNNVFAGHTG